jgi:5-methylcytosine-specific restriction endonuclease McrA
MWSSDYDLRERVFNKTGGFCFYCGRRLVLNSPQRKDRMTMDHLVPRSKGGNGYFHNLVPSCKRCNRVKGDTEDIEQFRFELTMDHFQKKYHVRFTRKHIEFLRSVLKVSVPARNFIFYFENSKNLRRIAEPLLNL